MPTGKVKNYNNERGFGFIKPDDFSSADVLFHESALRDGDQVDKGTAVSYEMGRDEKTGRMKAIKVDLVV
jgi:cold shock protein